MNNYTETDTVRQYLDGRLTSGTYAPAWMPEGIRTQVVQWARTNGRGEPVMSDETGRWVVALAGATYLVAVTRKGGAFISVERKAVAMPSEALLEFLFGGAPMSVLGL